MDKARLIELGMPIALRLAKEWELELGEPFANATSSLVCAANEDAVLRVPVIEEDSRAGYLAQLAFSGRGCVEVLRTDAESFSTLLRRIRPGTMLNELQLDPAEEVRACCSVMRRMQAEVFIGAIPIDRWYEPFLRLETAEAIPDELLRGAQRIAEELLESTSQVRLLHGDLHHFNILRDGSGWTAIDPFGLAADPAVEPAAFLRNPCTTFPFEPDIERLLSIRIATFADELGLDASRIRRWGIAHNVLSAWWDPPEERESTIRVVQAVLATSI